MAFDGAAEQSIAAVASDDHCLLSEPRRFRALSLRPGGGSGRLRGADVPGRSPHSDKLNGPGRQRNDEMKHTMTSRLMGLPRFWRIMPVDEICNSRCGVLNQNRRTCFKLSVCPLPSRCHTSCFVLPCDSFKQDRGIVIREILDVGKGGYGCHTL
jgi:hypothetical protein